MADKIDVQKPLSSQQQLKSSSPQVLKENFKSLSSNLSVAQVTQEATPQTKKSDEGAAKLSNSLKDAVKYSKQALKVLEDITAGDLNPDGVNKLLSVNEDTEEVEIQPRPRESVSVTELADDLSALKENLSSLFETLKEKSNKSDVLSENKQASLSDTKDLVKAQSKAESASLRIQFNGREALEVHQGLTINSVAKLLSNTETERRA